MTVLTIENVSKQFGTTKAVNDLSFEVKNGEIFAMLGPNGAGKTTTIRMALDILRPDNGRIQLFSQPINQETKDRIGYLPEERGLYQNIPVLDCLTYLGSLKGVPRRDAQKRAKELLERVELGEVMSKKVSQLSRGMQQKAQFIATIIHDPDLIIIDEPFSGLDPVNTLLIKEIIYEMKAQGKTIIMSTHMMHQVEEMASRMLMVNKGERVLYGSVGEIRQQYAAHAIYVDGSGDWATLPIVERATYDEREKAHLLFLHPDVTTDQALRTIAEQSEFHLTRFETALPGLADIFVEVVGRKVAE